MTTDLLLPSRPALLPLGLGKSRPGVEVVQVEIFDSGSVRQLLSVQYNISIGWKVWRGPEYIFVIQLIFSSIIFLNETDRAQ